MACVSLGRLVPAVADRLFLRQDRPAVRLIGLGVRHPRRRRRLVTVDMPDPVPAARGAVRDLRRPRRKSVCGGRRACERPRGLDRLRGAVLDAAVRLGARRRHRTHHRHIRHPTHRAERVFRLRLRADARVHRVRDLAPVPAQARRSGRRRARSSSPIRKHRRKSTHGCPITARPLEKRWPAPRPAMPRRASRPPRNLNRPAPQPKE